jgi:hypothetical protein
MIYGDTERCICVPNAAATPMGCVLCGENEVPGATGCGCAAGFVRGASNACEPAPAALGMACSEAMPCTDATFDHCATAKNGERYCTKTGCTGNSDCTGGYACDTSGATAYCRRPNKGGGMSCTMDSDCAGNDATLCETMFTHTCVEQGCSLSPNDCFSGTVCCNVGAPMLVCVPTGFCQS